MKTAALVLALVLVASPDAGADLQVGPPAQAGPSAPLHLVIPFQNATREPRVYWLSEASAVLLTDHLNTLGGRAIHREDRLRAFERLRVPPVSTLSHATVIRLGQVVGAAFVVVGSFEVQSDTLLVRARAIRLDAGQMTPEMVERGPISDLVGIYGRMSRRLVSESKVPLDQLARGYPPPAAFEQYIKGLLAEAPQAKEAFLTQALRLAPGFHRPRIALWQVHTDQGAHTDALATVKEIPADDPLSRQARFLGAVSMLHLRNGQTALAEFQALNQIARDPALLNNLGVAQLRSAPGSPGGRAVAYFGEAVSLDGTDPDLYFNVGYAYWLDRDTQGAIHWLREAVRRNPADDAAHYVLGVALQASGNAAEAAREKELARRLSSTYAEWEATQAGANAVPPGLERLKLELDVAQAFRVDAAVDAAGQRDQRAIATFHMDRARRFFDEGRNEDAVAELRRTIFLAPYDSQAHLLLARVYLRTGRQQDAVDALTIAVWSDANNAEAKKLLDALR